MFSGLEADMRERIISLAEENKRLKTEIEKIKLDYKGEKIKTNAKTKKNKN